MGSSKDIESAHSTKNAERRHNPPILLKLGVFHFNMGLHRRPGVLRHYFLDSLVDERDYPIKMEEEILPRIHYSDSTSDIQSHNMPLKITDKSVLPEHEHDELENPVLRKTVAGRTIYASRTLLMTLGTPVLCNSGHERLGDRVNRDDIMKDAHKAPEVILKMNYDYKVDIWNIEMMLSKCGWPLKLSCILTR
jgi:hypothetical protein